MSLRLALALCALCAGCGALPPFAPPPPEDKDLPELWGEGQLQALSKRQAKGRATAAQTEAELLARAQALQIRASSP